MGKKSKAKIYGEVFGLGQSDDAYHITAPSEDGRGAYNAMINALNDFKEDHDKIDYINAHGTSTPMGDLAETNAIKEVFNNKIPSISSTKSMTGHLLGAAGAIEAIAGILSINNNFVPPTINHFTDDPDLDPKLNLTFNEAQERKIDVMLSNTSGLGGHKESVVFKRFEG